MSINPGFSLLMGIDNLVCDGSTITDFRFTGCQYSWSNATPPLAAVPCAEQLQVANDSERMWRRALRLRMIQHHLMEFRSDGTEWVKQGYELIQHNGEYGQGCVIGYIIDSAYSDTWLYGLASVLPEMRSSGWWRLPSLSLEEDRSIEAHCLKRWLAFPDKRSTFNEQSKKAIAEKRVMISSGKNYPLFDSNRIRHWSDTALYLFDWIGLKVHPKELRLLLYWQWS